MIDVSKIDYSALDRPELLRFLFHPRPEWGMPGSKTPGRDLLIPVEDDVVVGASFYLAKDSAPNILLFHGNGEIVADYDEVGPLYNGMGINFLPVDYRGYGRSTGNPTITAMMLDSHVIFDFVRKWLNEHGYSGPIILMGRSLGSASVLELVFHYKSLIHGLIIESGFAHVEKLLQLMGVNLKALGFREEVSFGNVDKIRTFDKPTLIIHAERDHIIPFSDAQALYDACQAVDKTLLMIPKANHNDIFLRGISEYMAEVKTLADKTVNQVE